MVVAAATPADGVQVDPRHLKVLWADLSDDPVASDSETWSTGSSTVGGTSSLDTPRRRGHRCGRNESSESDNCWISASDSSVHGSPNFKAQTPPKASNKRRDKRLSLERISLDIAIATKSLAEDEPNAVMSQSWEPNCGTVIVEELPLKLCSGACLDAMLHQAGVHSSVVSFEVERGRQTGTVRIELSDWYACQRCHSHFATNSWSGTGLKVRIETAAPVAPAKHPRPAAAWQSVGPSTHANQWVASAAAPQSKEFVPVPLAAAQGTTWPKQHMPAMPYFTMVPVALMSGY